MSSSSFLGLARENALQGDAEVEHKEWLHVQMGLTAADACNGGRIQRAEVVVRREIGLRRRHSVELGGGNRIAARRARGNSRVYVRGDLGDGKGMALLATSLTERVTAAHVNGGTSL